MTQSNDTIRIGIDIGGTFTDFVLVDERTGALTLDMEGTSTDVALIYEGVTRITSESKVDGHPVLVPMIDIHSIGAGGGSIAWISETGALNVGPQSAGADPGLLWVRRPGRNCHRRQPGAQSA